MREREREKWWTRWLTKTLWDTPYRTSEEFQVKELGTILAAKTTHMYKITSLPVKFNNSLSSEADSTKITSTPQLICTWRKRGGHTSSKRAIISSEKHSYRTWNWLPARFIWQVIIWKKICSHGSEIRSRHLQYGRPFWRTWNGAACCLYQSWVLYPTNFLAFTISISINTNTTTIVLRLIQFTIDYSLK